MKHKFNLMNFIHALMLIASIILVLMVAVSIVEAQECGEFGYNCDDNSVVTDVANVTSVSNVIGGNENLAIGLSSPRFGAAIGDCMGTTASSYLWGIYGSQKLKESFWCESFNLIRAGYADAGTWILCNRTILKDMPDCPGPLAEMVTKELPIDTELVDKVESLTPMALSKRLLAVYSPQEGAGLCSHTIAYSGSKAGRR